MSYAVSGAKIFHYYSNGAQQFQFTSLCSFNIISWILVTASLKVDNTKFLLRPLLSRCDQFNVIVCTYRNPCFLNAIQRFNPKLIPKWHGFSCSWTSHTLNSIGFLFICTPLHANPVWRYIHKVQCCRGFYVLKRSDSSLHLLLQEGVSEVKEPWQAIATFTHHILGQQEHTTLHRVLQPKFYGSRNTLHTFLVPPGLLYAIFIPIVVL